MVEEEAVRDRECERVKSAVDEASICSSSVELKEMETDVSLPVVGREPQIVLLSRVIAQVTEQGRRRDPSM